MLTMIRQPTRQIAIPRKCFLLLSVFLLHSHTLIAQKVNDNPTLELGKPVERELIGGQSHSYRIELTSGQFIHLVVDQRGIDVVVTLFDPDHRQITEVDSPNGTQGPELLAAIAETAGTYRLEVRSLEKDAAPGRYQVKIEELRAAVEQDKSRIAAEQIFARAELLRLQGTKDSLQEAVKKYEEALQLYRVLNDRIREAMTLNTVGFIYDNIGEKEKALDYYGQALTLTRAAQDHEGEAATLNNLGFVYYSIGEKQRALAYFNEALPISRNLRNRQGEAATLNNIGMVYDSLGEPQKALNYYGQALALVRSIEDRSGEARTLSNIGVVYDLLGEPQKALDYFTQALLINRSIGDHGSEAKVLANIGAIYQSLGENQKALDNYEQALPLFQNVGDRANLAVTLSNIGLVYSNLGDREKALNYYLQALPIKRAVRDRSGEATTLNNIAAIYNSLGEPRRSLDLLVKALSIQEQIGDRGGKAMTINNIGQVYDSLGEPQKALDFYSQALSVRRTIGDRNGQAGTLNNIGEVYYSLGEQQKALDYFAQALTLRRAVGDRRGEAVTLNNIGAVYDSLGDTKEALGYYRQALPLRRTVGDRAGEATTLGNLVKSYGGKNNPRSATFYGKQAVNAYQQLRSKIQGLDQVLQKTYLRSVEQTYRVLAELLIAQGRVKEAQQVLNAFKDQQFFDFDSTKARQPASLKLTPREAELAARYEKVSTAVGAAGAQVTEFKRKLRDRKPTDEQAAQLQQLEATLKAASDELAGFMTEVETELSKPADEKDQVGEVSDMTQMQLMLRQFDLENSQKTVAVYTIIGESNLHALIITAQNITSVSTPVKGDELNKKARQFWALMQSADYDPTKLSNELYGFIFKPIEDKLPKDTKTIMWSLDGNLRYFPMAALYDGKRYLVEGYNHVVFTRVDAERLTRPVNSIWNGYGFATSGRRDIEVDGRTLAFTALDFVKEEMEVFRTKNHPNGIIEGEIFTDADFTKASLLATLKRMRPLVHISSHFRFMPGDESRSFLLLGDGKIMTLAEMKEQANLFQDVELLTLSACDTAAQRPDATGREVDAFAELAQRLGANGVVASLWAVRDRSTAQLMKEFYANREGGKFSKIEALRRAQLDLLHGNARSLATAPAQSAEQSRREGSTNEDVVVEAKYRIPFRVDKKKPFAHPYYWAPFVLFGNWK